MPIESALLLRADVQGGVGVGLVISHNGHRATPEFLQKGQRNCGIGYVRDRGITRQSTFNWAILRGRSQSSL